MIYGILLIRAILGFVGTIRKFVFSSARPRRLGTYRTQSPQLQLFQSTILQITSTPKGQLIETRRLFIEVRWGVLAKV